MKDIGKILPIVLIAVMTSIILGPSVHAAFDFKKKITVDHTRVYGIPEGYGYMKKITIDADRVSGSDQIDFPVLVSLTSDDLKSPGKVANANGYDIIFVDSNLRERLDHEIETYDGATGTLVAWVRVPVLKSADDTVIFLCYGNRNIIVSQENKPGVWEADYAGVWHLKENPATTGTLGIKDSSGNANHATDSGGMDASDSVVSAIGRGFAFDGVDDMIRIPDSASLDGLNDAATFSLWINFVDAADGDHQILMTSANRFSARDGYEWASQGDGDHFFYPDATTSDGNYNLGPNPFTNGQWLHLTATMDFASREVKIYVDGNEMTFTHEGVPTRWTDLSNSGDLLWGGNPDRSSRYFLGMMDEIRLADVVRSQDWIQTEYNNHKWPNKADWPTDGFITVTDAVGTDFTDFPVLVSIQNDPQLKTTANGGLVTDANGFDIIFSSDLAGTLQLDHEVESYDGTTGTLVGWVRLPILKTYEDTEFYLHYSNSSISTSQENGPGVWDANYQGVWHLNQDPGPGGTGDIKDSTANANHGTAHASMTPSDLVSGPISGALDFDEVDDYVTIGDQPELELPVYSWSAWIRTDHAPVSGIENEQPIDNANSQFNFAWNHWSADFMGSTAHEDSAGWKSAQIASPLLADTWYYVVGTYDGSAIRIYLNGSFEDATLAGAPLASAGDFNIGNDASGPCFAGQLDEVRISNTARNAGWIGTAYNNHRWPNKAQWPNEGFITVERGVCESATPVTCGSTTASAIATAGDWQSYEVTLADSNRLVIYTTGTTDTFGHLYDGNCNQIAQDDTADGNFEISQTLAAGTYYIQVRHALAAGTGSYDLVVECSDDDHGDELEEATTLECNSSIGGEIGSGGDVDYFKAVFWGTGILKAYSTGDNETYGTLMDEAGNLIAADDNSGADNRFEIVQTVSPGVYYIEVKHDDPTKTCLYDLHLECEYTPVITASAEYGGTISPQGAVGVTYDTNQSFSITPAAGNTIRDVWVDGVWVGPVTSYEFTNVQTDHKIVAVFNADFENCVDIPDIPLDAWYRSAPANVMFVLDDSGSMDWEFMTVGGNGLFEGYYRYVFDDPGDNLYGRVLPDNRRMRWKSQWAVYNQMYYDPEVEYEPWPNHVAGAAALTLDPADPDTPRSHPMHAGTTFNLNGTYYQFTSDTGAVIVDDGDTEFDKTPAGAGGQTLLSTGFEEATDAEAKQPWSGNGAPDWRRSTDQSHSGSYSGRSDKTYQGDVISDDLDASDLVAANGDSITVEFWFRKRKIEDNEFVLYYYDGSGYDKIVDFEPGNRDNRWIHYKDTITDSQYFISNFRIRFHSSLNKSNEYVWIDDVAIIKKGAHTGASWEQATGSDQAHNDDYWWTGADGDYTATWTPDIPADGDYDVYARWHADDHHSENVPYTINHAGGATTVTVNQRQDGGNWVKLGNTSYNFNAGTGGNVTITYTRSGDTDRVCADAVKFVPAGTIDAIDIKRAHYYVWSKSENKPYLVVLDQGIDYYEVNDANANDEIEDGEIAPTVTPPADIQTGRTLAEEKQNFANWYQYYRRRELAASAAVANTIVGLKGVQVGFYSINGNVVQPVVPVKAGGVDKSKSLLQALYNLTVKANGTPLRRGLREVGKYFSDSSDMIGSSPYATLANGGACQQAFTIVMTDGFWNGGNPSAGNADGDGSSAFDGGAHADIYFNTLADVAMHYYETDLHTGLDNHVPTNASDAATHQHMVTYAVSFGVLGSLNPADYDIANGSYPVWPDPTYADRHKIDDLWHAAVNGRGEFLNASNPTELVDSLLAISRSIDDRITSSSSVSVNGDPLYHELNNHTRMYQALYRSDGWIGDVNAYEIDSASGDVSVTPEWSAADQLETLNWNTDRVIATFDGTQGIPFRYDRDVLSADQQTALGSDLVDDSASEQQAVRILNYLRGERSNEAQNGGTLRDRFQMLGDIVHSSPVYSHGMLYAGGNDGMLHAFDAATGIELFGYVPNLVFGNLSALADPDYSHKYYVDLSPAVADISLSGQSKTYLVGGLGKGGRGYYALDVTNAKTDITDESTLADRVLWEFPNPQGEGRGSLAFQLMNPAFSDGDEIYTKWPNGAKKATAQIEAIPYLSMSDGVGIFELINVSGTFLDGEDLYVGAGTKVAVVNGRLYDAYMGYSFSRPVIARSNDPAVEWLVLFGNGYNSQRSHAVLNILNLATGDVIRRIDTGVGNCNGLSSPIAIDIDSNGTADYVYAGDLQGNLWKFDLQDANAANWTVAYQDPDSNPAPVFQAKNLSGHHQPITSKPDVMYHCEKRGYMVVFGTGRYLTELDLESTESNTIYGIWDYGDDDDNSEYLGSFERAAVPQLSNAHLDGVATWTRVELLEQTVESGSWTTTDGRNLRVITANDPDWGTVADSDVNQLPDPGSLTVGDMVHAGWYFDLPNVGEMVVSDVMIRDGKLLVISFTPGRNPCGSGGTSIFHALRACSGGRTNSAVFVDINGIVYNPVSGSETTITRTGGDWKEPSGIEFTGRLQPPVILRTGGTEFHYLSSSTGDIYKQEAAAAQMGVFYWLQVE
ncbi:MAG: PilC/PilY family type IV pilus protein [Desulfobacterales bacterium]|nr:PilC/PilY family type IV pilus protein [Desulfobacterales bacterium]